MGYMAEDFPEHALREPLEEHFDWTRRYRSGFVRADIR
jgi:hypothetical protein